MVTREAHRYIDVMDDLFTPSGSSDRM